MPSLVVALTANMVQAQASVRLEAASARVQIVDGGDVEVLLRYALVAADGTRALRLRAIPFFGLTITDLAATVDGEAARVELTSSGDAGVEARVTPVSTVASDRMIAVDLQYRVAHAVARKGARLDVRAPVLLLDAFPASSHEGFFDAELITPPGVALIESFPAVNIRQTSGAVSERFASTLQVVPSLLRWRTTTGSAPRLSFAAAVDLAMLLLIAGLGVIGARVLRKTA